MYRHTLYFECLKREHIQPLTTRKNILRVEETMFIFHFIAVWLIPFHFANKRKLSVENWQGKYNRTKGLKRHQNVGSKSRLQSRQ